ncbi:hypothetical protein KM043_007865 [Ampulex compressa]|nr:hypothetical protein KM043_007865 [Ampulex compressa]
MAREGRDGKSMAEREIRGERHGTGKDASGARLISDLEELQARSGELRILASRTEAWVTFIVTRNLAKGDERKVESLDNYSFDVKVNGMMCEVNCDVRVAPRAC